MKKLIIFTFLLCGQLHLVAQSKVSIWEYSKISLVGGMDVYFSNTVGFVGLKGFNDGNKTQVATRFGIDLDTPAWGIQYTYGTGLLNHSLTTRYYIFRGIRIRHRPKFGSNKRIRKHKLSLQ